MPITALYRISSLEVIKISLTGQLFTDRNTTYWGVLTAPALPDGNQVRDMSGPTMGPLRVLGLAKFAVTGTNTIRNATQPEIDTFAGFQTTDEAAMDASQAVVMSKTHPMWRKVVKAIIKLVIAELNILRSKTHSRRIGSNTLVWDPANMANATGTTSPGIAVAGAAFGDFVDVGVSASLAGIMATGYVSAVNTVNIRLHNGTGSAVNLASMTYTVLVRRDDSVADRTNQQGYDAMEAQVNGND